MDNLKARQPLHSPPLLLRFIQQGDAQLSGEAGSGVGREEKGCGHGRAEGGRSASTLSTAHQQRHNHPSSSLSSLFTFLTSSSYIDTSITSLPLHFSAYPPSKSLSSSPIPIQQSPFSSPFTVLTPFHPLLFFLLFPHWLPYPTSCLLRSSSEWPRTTPLVRPCTSVLLLMAVT